MDATRAIQDSIHVFSLVRKYVSRILGTYQIMTNALYVILYLVRFVLLANFLFFSFLANRIIYPTTNPQYQ